MTRISKDQTVSSQDRLFGAHTIIHDGESYMTRYWFWRFRIHVFHRGDKDQDCHDHPWDFWTFPLTSYVEEVLQEMPQARRARDIKPAPKFYTTTQVVKRFRAHRRSAEHCHRVLGSFEGYEESFWRGLPNALRTPKVGTRRIVTLVYQGGVRRKWGFWKLRNGRWCWEFWKKYALEGGRDQPCS